MEFNFYVTRSRRGAKGALIGLQTERSSVRLLRTLRETAVLGRECAPLLFIVTSRVLEKFYLRFKQQNYEYR